MSRKELLPAGTLPADAQFLLRSAAKVGTTGSVSRTAAIQRAYRIIEERYPQYLKQEG